MSTARIRTYSRIAEGAIEGDEVEDRTQHGEDRDGGARVNHERRDEHPADRQFGKAVQLRRERLRSSRGRK